MATIHLDNVPHSGSFIVAVSGGLDSTVLLHLLKDQRPKLRLVVAHIEHGIRGEASRQDAAFVRQMSADMGYDFEIHHANLGQAASEEMARDSRYKFLEELCRRYAAAGIMTAHHQDDVLETICLNILRGTGWRGLCSLRSTSRVIRPLLNYSKVELRHYAEMSGLKWRHDATNDSDRYARNRIRHTLVTKMTPQQRAALIDSWRRQCRLRQQIEDEVAQISSHATLYAHAEWTELRRYYLTMVPRAVAYELLRHAGLQVAGHSLLQAQLEQLRVFACTGRPGSVSTAGAGLKCRATKRGVVVGRAQIW